MLRCQFFNFGFLNYIIYIYNILLQIYIVSRLLHVSYSRMTYISWQTIKSSWRISLIRFSTSHPKTQLISISMVAMGSRACIEGTTIVEANLMGNQVPCKALVGVSIAPQEVPLQHCFRISSKILMVPYLWGTKCQFYSILWI